MEIKFNGRTEQTDELIISNRGSKIMIGIFNDEKEKHNKWNSILLDSNDLYSLIGQLLRMQTEVKKEVSNG